MKILVVKAKTSREDGQAWNGLVLNVLPDAQVLFADSFDSAIELAGREGYV